MAPIKFYHYCVVGRGMFPADMLRYDQCHPGDTDSAVNITTGPHDADLYREFRMIHLTGLREPTEGRWRSFSWFVYKDPILGRKFMNTLNSQ